MNGSKMGGGDKLGNFYFIYFFLGGGKNSFLKNGGDKLGNFLFLFYFIFFFGGGETLFKKMVHCTQKYLHIPYFLPIFVGGGLFLKKWGGGSKLF